MKLVFLCDILLIQSMFIDWAHTIIQHHWPTVPVNSIFHKLFPCGMFSLPSWGFCKVSRPCSLWYHNIVKLERNSNTISSSPFLSFPKLPDQQYHWILRQKIYWNSMQRRVLPCSRWEWDSKSHDLWNLCLSLTMVAGLTETRKAQPSHLLFVSLWNSQFTLLRGLGSLSMTSLYHFCLASHSKFLF